MKMIQWLLSMSAVPLLFAAATSQAEGKKQSPRSAAPKSAAKHAVTKMSTEAEACPAATDALQLTGTQPYAVNVRVNSSGIPEFSAPGSSTSYTQLAWTVGANQTSAQIAFTFVSGSQQITTLTTTTSGLTFGSSSSGAQSATVQPVAGKFLGCYHFDVETTQTAIDPIIIVSVPP